MFLDICGAKRRLGIGVQVGAQSSTAPLYWVFKFSKARCKMLRFESRAKHLAQYTEIPNNVTMKRGLKVRINYFDRAFLPYIPSGFQLQDPYRISLTVEDRSYITRWIIFLLYSTTISRTLPNEMPRARESGCL